MTRLLQWGRLRRIFWQCEGQWRSIIRGYQDRSQGNNDGRCPFIVQCMFTMHGLDVYYDLTASFYSSRVWRSFSTVMTSKCPTFANSSSTPKAKDLMVLRGFILLVNLVRLCLLLSYANATEDGQGHKKEDKSGRMNWEVRSGMTFLAVEWVRLGKGVRRNTEYISLYDSPPSWVNTVGNYQNWI